MGTPRTFTFSTYHPDDPAVVGKCHRAEYIQGCDALRDAMWSIANRIAGEYRQPAADLMVRLHNPPLPIEFGGRP